MTCAHVVAAALGEPPDLADPPRQAVAIQFAVDDDIVAEASVVPHCWRARQARDRGDIAVLEIASGQPVPPNARPVFAVEQDPLPGEGLIGLGVRADAPQGSIIQGIFLDYLPGGRRRAIRAAGPDQSIGPGCSGAAAFSYSGGIAGMVVEMQQLETGLLIPLANLREIFPIPARESGASEADPGASRPTSEASVRRRLADRLLTFDREDQQTYFEIALDEVWQARKLPIVYLIGGLEADLPDLCQQRCLDVSLARRFGPSIASDHLTPLRLPWPPDLLFDVTAALNALKRTLQRTLDAEDGSPPAIQAALSQARRAFFFFSDVRAEKFGRLHKKLIRAWSEFLEQAVGAGFDEPLIHFLRITLPKKDFNPRREDPDEPLRIRYQKLTQATISPVVRPLPALQGFTPPDVRRWLASSAGDLRIPPEKMAELQWEADERFAELNHPRLNDLQKWIYRLN
jgi:hypothetical protein